MTEPKPKNQNGPGPTLHERTAADGQRELLLVKHGQRYVFRCARGQETQLLDQIIEMARDADSGIQWFDAAMLSHQLGSRMADQLQRAKEINAP